MTYRGGWHRCPKHNVWRAFDDDEKAFDNDEKVASSKNHAQFKTRVQQSCPVYEKKLPKSMPYLRPKRLKHLTPALHIPK